MPIPFPDTYDTLRLLACKGVSAPFAGQCEKCHANGSFNFTGNTVSRGGVIPNTEVCIAYRNLRIPLARCSECGHYVRVLPQELLPRKTFGVRVIEKAFRNYLFSEQSLRKAVSGIVLPVEHTPSHTTLSR